MKLSTRRVTAILSPTLERKHGRQSALSGVSTFLLWALLLAGLCGPCSAITVGPPDLQSSVEQADVIVEGQVVDTTSAWVEDQRGRHIYTTVTLQVSQVLKGYAQPEIKIEVIGGTVGEITERVSDTPIFSKDMQAVLLLRQAPLRLIPGEGAVYQVRDGMVHADNRELSVGEFKLVIEGLAPRKAADQIPISAVKRDSSAKGTVAETVMASISPQRSNAVVTVPAEDQATPSAKTGITASVWQTIKSENFDGAWPNDWQLSSNYTSGGTPITWAPETYVYCSSSPKGGWPHASVIDPNVYYFLTANPGTSIDSWMVYGPFSLSDATDANMTFNLKYQLGAGDSVGWYASTDGGSFYGSGLMGGSNSSCSPRTFDLKSVPTLGNLCGQSQVWIAFIGSADDVQDYVDGPFIDDIVLSKYAEACGSPPPAITNIAPDKASAGTSSQVTITGTDFGATQGAGKVEFFYRTGQPKIQAPIISWSDTQIVCTVPIDIILGYPASSGSGPVTVTTCGGTSNGYEFKVTFGYDGTKWYTVPVGYRINENTADCTGEGAALQAAATSWSDACAAFSFRYDGAHSNTSASLNDYNDIMWKPALGSGILAATYIWSSSSQIIECDVVFNDDYTWSADGAGGTFDIQTIGVHELGHWLDLRDLYGDLGDNEYDVAKIMYGYGSSGTTKRSLHTDDTDGIQWIYGLLSAPTDPSADPSAIGPGGSSTLSATPGAGGDTIFWLSGSCGGTYVGTGTPLSVSPTSTTTYYAKTQNSTTGCLSPSCADGVTVTVDNIPPTTTAAPPGGLYDFDQEVALTADESATIYYTTDGTEPTTSSSQYSTPIPITVTTTLRFFAKDTAGNEESPKQEVYTIDKGPDNIGIVRGEPATGLILRGIVTAMFDSFMYVESADRSSGVRVMDAPTEVYVRDRVRFIGDTELVNGEKQITPTSAIGVFSGGNPLPYLGMRTRDVGGHDYGPNDPGVTNGLGALNVGLYVTVHGLVTYRDTSGSPSFFYIWDGGNRGITKVHDGNSVATAYGVRIKDSGWIPDSDGAGPEVAHGAVPWFDWVEVEGVVSVNTTAVEGRSVPEIIPVVAVNGLVAADFTDVSTPPSLVGPPVTGVLWPGKNLLGVPYTPGNVGNGASTGVNQGYDPAQVISYNKQEATINNKLIRWDSGLASLRNYSMFGEPHGIFGGIILGDGYWLTVPLTPSWEFTYKARVQNIPQWIAPGAAGKVLISNPVNNQVMLDPITMVPVQPKENGIMMSDGAQVVSFREARFPISGGSLGWIKTKGDWFYSYTQSWRTIGISTDFPNTKYMEPWMGVWFTWQPGYEDTSMIVPAGFPPP